ncbi:hypothetical protein GOBAR_AA21087 [Gossypium barbadense]|uniref:Cation-transporting P-type ATPase N-terminal domain-containing protein n=1 Tax=Gossypium barbadense TaxID=3634 RepID=A0A2P5X8C1_GOSBA|nr:hypothetical protein GOBAR_AA21087 [Gossypium barbadense]
MEIQKVKEMSIILFNVFGDLNSVLQSFILLRTSRAGLTSEDAEVRNKLEEKPENKFLKFLSFIRFILFYKFFAAAVMGHCSLPMVLRDGQWQEKALPGDIISIKLGDIIPCRCSYYHVKIPVLSVTLAIGSHRLSQQGAITKRMTAIEEMAGMDVLCSDKTGTLTLNRLTVDRNLVEVFSKNMDKDLVVLLAARASRLENQDAIDAAIINMLADPKEARANIKEVHFLPFNPVDKRTAITYIDSDGNCKGLFLCPRIFRIVIDDDFVVILNCNQNPREEISKGSSGLHWEDCTLRLAYANLCG